MLKEFPRAAARRVLHDDIGIAGNEAADLARDEAAVGVVAAARIGTDVDREALGLVEVGDGVGVRADSPSPLARAEEAARGISAILRWNKQENLIRWSKNEAHSFIGRYSNKKSKV